MINGQTKKVKHASVIPDSGILADLEGIAQLQHGSTSADKLAASRQAALDDSKQLAAGLEHIGLLSILHRLPSLLSDQSLHCVTQLLFFRIHIYTAKRKTDHVITVKIRIIKDPLTSFSRST